MNNTPSADTRYTNSSTTSSTTFETVSVAIDSSISPTKVTSPHATLASTSVPAASPEAALAKSARISFGRSPQCTVSWDSYIKKLGGSYVTKITTVQAETALTTGMDGFFIPYVGDITTRITKTGVFQVTATLTETVYGYNDPCCGHCSIYYESVNVRYWPVASSNTDCVGNSSYYGTNFNLKRSPMTEGPNSYPPRHQHLAPRGASPVHNVSHAGYDIGPDGFTYISPYAYVVFPTIYAADSCGPLGTTHKDLTLSFAPGELSTVEGRLGPVKSFNFADLPCPPMSVAKADWYNFHPMDGRPYAPIIAPASQLYSLDPLWSTCYVDIYEGYDPPYALTPATALAQTTEPAPIAKPTDPQPQDQAPSGPIQTQSPKMFNPQTASAKDPPSSQDPPLPKPSEVLPSQDPTVNPLDIPLPPSQPLSAATPKGQGPPSRDPSRQTLTPPDFRTSNLPVATPTIPIFATLTTISPIPVPSNPGGIVSTQTVTGDAVTTPVVIAGQTARFESSALVIGSQTITAGIATIGGTPISIPAGGSAIVVAGTAVPLPIGPPESAAQATGAASLDPPLSLYQLGTNTLTVDSTGGYVVDGHTLSSGQPAITVSGTIVSLGPSLLILGTQTYALPTPSRDLLTPGAVITAAGQTFTPNPTGFVIAGSTLVQGGPAVIISGTPISLGSLGLAIGTTGTTLRFPASSPFHITFTTDGLTFAAAPTGLVINGVETLRPGEAVTMNGTVVSLTPGQPTLVIGSDSIPLATTTTMGLGGLIMSGFGPPPSQTSPIPTATTTKANGTVLTLFAGKSSRQGVVWREMGFLVMGVALWVGFS